MPKVHIVALDYVILFLSLIFIGLAITGILTFVNHKAEQRASRSVVYQRALSYHPLTKRDKSQGITPRYNFPDNTLNVSERDLFLNLHNDFRRLNKAGKLTWDDRLAESAQAWADKLYSDDCDIYHPKNPEDDEEYLQSGHDGQNLSQFVYEGKPRKNLQVGSIKHAVKLWTDECHVYNPKHPTKNGVGHFTQLIWKDTDKLGCAYRTLDRENKKASVYVCHYNKSGNWLTPDGGFTHFKENVESSPVCSP
jgi:pathogenesis-related protein 1